jgi:hypothetical protein
VVCVCVWGGGVMQAAVGMLTVVDQVQQDGACGGDGTGEWRAGQPGTIEYKEYPSQRRFAVMATLAACSSMQTHNVINCTR